MTEQTSAKPSRRHFYHLSFIYGLGAAIGAMVSVPAFVYLFLPPRAKKKAQWVDAADLSQIQIGTPAGSIIPH